MIKLFLLGDVKIYFSFFTPEEAALGQMKAQSAAVRRIIRHATSNEVEILHDDDGAPYLSDHSAHISISHCEGAAAVGFHDHDRIGIDIERPRSQLPRVKHKFLSPEETAQWEESLLMAWTIKEAAYKAAGVRGLPLVEGIHIKNPDSVEVTLPEDKSIVYNIYSVTCGEVCITAVSRQ